MKSVQPKQTESSSSTLKVRSVELESTCIPFIYQRLTCPISNTSLETWQSGFNWDRVRCCVVGLTTAAFQGGRFSRRPLSQQLSGYWCWQRADACRAVAALAAGSSSCWGCQDWHPPVLDNVAAQQRKALRLDQLRVDGDRHVGRRGGHLAARRSSEREKGGESEAGVRQAQAAPQGAGAADTWLQSAAAGLKKEGEGGRAGTGSSTEAYESTSKGAYKATSRGL
eukprot:366429-Chlamydomonas_euryale.AAC.1